MVTINGNQDLCGVVSESPNGLQDEYKSVVVSWEETCLQNNESLEIGKTAIQKEN